jgi:hypothetical protein
VPPVSARRAGSRETALCHIADGDLVVIDLTSDRLPRRPRADAERSLSSNAASTFAAAGGVPQPLRHAMDEERDPSGAK